MKKLQILQAYASGQRDFRQVALHQADLEEVNLQQANPSRIFLW